jgi:magnesium chelatase subunit I
LGIASAHPRTFGELKRTKGFDLARLAARSVKDEMRENLLCALRRREPVFPGIVGYDDTVVPQIANAILSRHNFILLGLRGQAKSRILRDLARLLDAEVPAVRGCEIHDNPARPVCATCRRAVADAPDDVALEFLGRDQRYVEKLATPDVTIADLIGDIDPIKAARGGHELSSELTVHYGLLPRANRGILAINELPDLAGKIQVGLFNIMQEGDVQIKGYPVRLPLDVALVFSANPEDYTARGKIITPLKDRIGSEIRTHYPATLDEGVAITRQEAAVERCASDVLVPDFIRELIEAVAFAARADKRVDKRSGVSQRMPITCLENAVSNAERRAVLAGESPAVPGVRDVYAALPSLTGKLELEYEGEMKGADVVARDLVRQASAATFERYFTGTEGFGRVIQWFEIGGTLQIEDDLPARDSLQRLQQINGLDDHWAALGLDDDAPDGLKVAAAELILEGLYAHKRISRSEDRVYRAEEKKRVAEAAVREPLQRTRRPLN